MQVKLSGPIQAISGSLDKNSGAYFTTRNGKTFLCFRRQHKYPTLRGFVCHRVSEQLKQANL